MSQAVEEIVAERDEAVACVRELTELLEEVMPQMGRMVLQDYGKLNRVLLESGAILRKHDEREAD